MREDTLLHEILNLSKGLNKTNLNIRKNNVVYKNIFDGLPIMLFVTESRINSKGTQKIKFINVNDKVLSKLGYTKEEIVEIPFFDLIHPDDENITQNIISNTENITDSIISGFVNRYRTKSGEYISVKWLGSIDTIMGEVHVAQDITELIEFQSKYVYMDLLFKNYPTFLIVTNLRNEIYLINNKCSKILKTSYEDVVGKDISEVIDLGGGDVENTDGEWSVRIDVFGNDMCFMRDSVYSSKGDIIGYIYTGYKTNNLKKLYRNLNIE